MKHLEPQLKRPVLFLVVLAGAGLALNTALRVDAQPPTTNSAIDPNAVVLATPEPLATPPGDTGDESSGTSTRVTRAVGTITGQGTAGFISKFTAPNAIGNSVLYEKTGRVGLNNINPSGTLEVTAKTTDGYAVHTTNPGTGYALYGSSVNGPGIYGLHSAATGTYAGATGESNSNDASASGVVGTIRSTAPGVDSAGVRGANKGTNANGSGVIGTHTGRGVGVTGTSALGTGVFGDSASGTGVRGRHTASSGTTPAVLGESNSTSSSANAIQGVITSTSPGGTSAGVRGINNGTGSLGIGVYGSQAGSGYGVYGTAPSGYGVIGTSTSGFGVYGTSSNSYGIYGSSSSSSGIYGYSSSSTGVSGNSYSNYGVKGFSTSSYGVYGQSNSSIGVYGYSSGGSGAGVLCQGYVGVQGQTNGTDPNSQGVRGDNGNSNTNGYAGVFNGRVVITGNLTVGGTLSKNAGSFKIDHPLDPGHKYLSHSFVESPDMMNIYNGNVITDENGRATVTMPDYFSALNSDFRYALTPIGAPGPNLYVAKEIKGNKWEIAGGKPGLKVSWQVTGIRRDAYARDHRIKVVENKSLSEQGHYLYPAGFGAGQDKLIGAPPRVAAAPH